MTDHNKSNDLDLSQMRELIAAASPPPVDWGCVRGKSVEQHVEDFRGSMSADTAVGVDLHGVYLGGTETVVCHTGNGPTSEANAKLITFALNNLGKLVDEIERLRRIVARNATSATHRLHNLCDGLAEDADESPFTRDEWARIDRQTVHMQSQLRQIADIAARGLEHVDDLSALDGVTK